MQRRQFISSLGGPALLLAAACPAWAETVSALSESDAASGIRAALERGAAAAVASLGRADGFLGNPKVRIPLPRFLNEAAKLLRLTGQQRRVEDIEVAMNRAAESAVPEARSLLINAVKAMSVEDARHILQDGGDSATRFFAAKTREPLGMKFLPIVTRATERVALVDKYNALASRGASFGLMSSKEANLQSYVTERTLDGLYLMIGEEERKIRADPVATGSAVLKRVFGAMSGR